MLDRIIASALPFVPRGVVRRVAGRYIAGTEMRDAIELSARLAQRGFVTTIDQLGEDVVEADGARAAADGYVRLIAAMAEAGAERNVSIKLSQLGLRFDAELARDELERVLAAAAAHDFFVRLDMEDATLTDATLRRYLDARERWPRIGAVLQARLRRTIGDARVLAAMGANVRLCKGIYPESRAIAFQDREEIRASFVESLRALLEGGAYVGVATHDLPLIASVEREIAAAGHPRNRYEFQALLGVPIRTELERLRDAGNQVRIYVPYGDDWLAYGMRRLKENPHMAGAIAAGLLKRDRLDGGARLGHHGKRLV
jgi:proline dehydrogenase